MSYATRATVIAGFFTFYYRQRAGSCFIGAFAWITALLGYVLPSLNLPSGPGSPESPAGSVYLPAIAARPASTRHDLITPQATTTNPLFRSKTCKRRCLPGDPWVFSSPFLPSIGSKCCSCLTSLLDCNLVHPTGFHPA